MSTAKKILIVDDNKNCSDLYKDQLEFLGFVVKQVWTGEAVAPILPDFDPDLIILDLMLPGISGEEVLGILKKNEETKNIPVIVLTAMLYGKDEEARIRKKADDYLIKIDITPHQLGEKVAKLLAKS